MTGTTTRLTRDFFDRAVIEVARDLLGRTIVSDLGGDRIAVRLTEVEAYAGQDDPASHAFRGRTRRTAVMFGPAGHLYTYFVYGMHWCANIVTGPAGHPSAVLLRAGAVVEGLDSARTRRPRATTDHQLARGPAGLATVLGFDAAANGVDLCAPAGRVELLRGDRHPLPRCASDRGWAWPPRARSSSASGSAMIRRCRRSGPGFRAAVRGSGAVQRKG